MLAILRGIASGLDAVHACGLVHRDVKPGNVVVETTTSRPVLVDFGLARTCGGTTTALVSGTPAYIAPEQARGASATPRSDLYALACMAFELLTSRTPFEGFSSFRMLVAHMNAPAPALSSRRPDLAALDGVFDRALAKDPADRQPSCRAFVAELESPHASVAPPPPASRVRVLVLDRDDERDEDVLPVFERTLRAPGDDVAVEHVASGAKLEEAFAREPADVVLIHESRVADSEPLVRTLRAAPCGEVAEVIVLAEPASPSVARRAATRVGSRIAERRPLRTGT